MAAKPFNTDEPIAYFITWTTYGSWLPGDERGWRNRRAAGVNQPNSLVKAMALSDMRELKFLLNNTDRNIVESTVKKHCEIRGWILHALNARSNHVHVVVTATVTTRKPCETNQGVVHKEIEAAASQSETVLDRRRKLPMDQFGR